MKMQATVDPTWNLCTRYPLLLSGQKQCRMRNLLKVAQERPISPQRALDEPLLGRGWRTRDSRMSFTGPHPQSQHGQGGGGHQGSFMVLASRDTQDDNNGRFPLQVVEACSCWASAGPGPSRGGRARDSRMRFNTW